MECEESIKIEIPDECNIPEDIEDIENVVMPEPINFTISGIRALILINKYTGMDVHQAVNHCVKLFAKELKNKEV
jgi:hypothetical protein